jgi:hypothetical protein
MARTLSWSLNPCACNDEQQRLVGKSRNAEAADGFEGPFKLKAIWTMD